MASIIRYCDIICVGVGLRHTSIYFRACYLPMSHVVIQALMLPEAVRMLYALKHALGKRVYVHCTAGINRATLTVVGYLTFVQVCSPAAATATRMLASRSAGRINNCCRFPSNDSAATLLRSQHVLWFVGCGANVLGCSHIEGGWP